MKNFPIIFSLALSLLIGSTVQAQTSTTKEKFQPSDASLQQYQYPEWFRDAKFGIWAHWGPQAVPRQGDWYARKMYVSNIGKGNPDPDYTDHLNRYGHPSVKGYKDIIPLWKAEKWNPEELMKLYKRVGAKYFVSMGTHHDNFFLWNSKLHRWNSVNMGPHRDVVGEWQKAAKKEGLPFGVSEHLGASYTWFQVAHGADLAGDKVGVPYDGNDPQYQDLYHERAYYGDNGWLTTNPKWQHEWYDRICELIDNYHPDLLYSDSGLPFGNIGRSLIAHLYNQSLDKNGNPSAVYTCKEASNGRFVRDVERGIMEDISPYPWQTDTSIGDWFYRTGQKYMTSDEVIQMLTDIVSKNGNLLLNIVQTPEGDLEPDVMNILEGIATWIKDNGEAIYSTRPWTVYGEGPSVVEKQAKGFMAGVKDVRPYRSGDIRFTQKDGVLYIFSMVHPESDLQIHAINGQIVASVCMLGSKQKVKWSQNAQVLTIGKPSMMPSYSTIVFKVKFKK
ncbi:MAG: alpha-L-fucosidase [Prevotella sp.]|jgi:alpha-L-fucosidase|nr:alpha-L-fucosidase [Prevotella sp.]MCI1281860.1 alpha-L-fucosidase [Prevotella sp.]